MEEYNIIADLHTHTLASTHAFSTITEMIKAAAEKGLYAIAITDHGKLMPGSPGEWYFSCIYEIPLRYRGVLNLAGIEANVMDFQGNLDLTFERQERLDWVVASVHHIGLPGLADPNVERCTEMWMRVADNPKVNVIGHSGDPLYAYDYDKVIPYFGERHKLVEINNHTFDARKGNVENCKKIALACKKYGVPIVVNSDAHFESYVGEFGNALKLLSEISFPKELILNASVDSLNKYLEEYTGIFTRRS